MAKLFSTSGKFFSRLMAMAIALSLSSDFVGAVPAIGTVWQRSVDWSTPSNAAAGTTNGNPAADAQGNLVWQYESVPLGSALGQPTTNGEAANYWCLENTAKLTWDTSWYGGAGGWTAGAGVSPLINQFAVYQSLDNTTVPAVRWLNPTSTNVTVALAGIISLQWSSTNLLLPIDFILMLQKPDGTKTPLVLGSRKPRNYPNSDGTVAPDVLIDLPAVQVPVGGSIFYTMRYEDAAYQPQWVTLIDTNLTITLKALTATPLLTNDTAVTDANESVNIEVLVNDCWAPQALPRVSVLANPAHGAATVRADQSIDYRPATNFIGEDIFTYQVFDGIAIATASVTVTVNQPYYIYVSPNGSDANTGTSWTNALANIEAARDRIPALRAMNQSPLANRAVEVVLDDGIYATNHVIQFTTNDGGTAPFPVTYRARNSLKATISSAQKLNLSWQSYATVPGAFVADLSVTGLTQTHLNNWHTLIVNGSLAARTRLPAAGFYSIVSANTNFSDTYNRMNSFTFGSSNGQPNISAAWKNLTNVEVISYATWSESRMQIASVDVGASEVHVQGSLPYYWSNDYLADYGAYEQPTAPYNQTGATDGTIRYYLENILEALNAPSQWYVDPAGQKLYYYPRAGETISNATFAVPVLDQLIQINGASNLRFDGLNFCDTDWIMPTGGQPGLGQAVALATPNTISIANATNVVFENDYFTRNGGGYGIQIQFGASGNSVLNSEFATNDGGAVMIGTFTTDNGNQSFVASNRIALNNIHDNQLVWREASGIIALRNGYNHINGNVISNSTYCGITSGWFDNGNLAVGHNQFNWNTISTFGTMLYDLAGIYVLGDQPYTTIMGNIISGGVWTTNHLHHGGVNYPADGINLWNNPGGPIAGIYTDDTSKGELIDGNIIYNCNQGLFIHDSYDEIYRNNIYINTQPQTWGTMYAANAQGYLDAGPLWIGCSVFAWTESNAAPDIFFDSYQPLPWLVMDSDIYSYGPVTIEAPQNFGLPYLQSNGHEQNAIVTTNTLFVSPATHDFRIAASAQPLLLAQGFSADWLFAPAITATPPVASFTVSATNGFAPLHLIFSDSSTGSVTNWSWNFGDGVTVTTNGGVSISHDYLFAGNYTVMLTVSGADGLSNNTQTALITVSAPPTIGSTSLDGGKFVLKGSNCPAGIQYRILTATNPALSMANWQPITTNHFLPDGSFIFTNQNSGRAAFFRLVAP